MRSTVTINDELIERAVQLSGISDRSALLREALQTLVRVESARRLARLGGTDPQASTARRRRNDVA